MECKVIVISFSCSPIATTMSWHHTFTEIHINSHYIMSAPPSIALARGAGWVMRDPKATYNINQNEMMMQTTEKQQRIVTMGADDDSLGRRMPCPKLMVMITMSNDDNERWWLWAMMMMTGDDEGMQGGWRKWKKNTLPIKIYWEKSFWFFKSFLPVFFLGILIYFWNSSYKYSAKTQLHYDEIPGLSVEHILPASDLHQLEKEVECSFLPDADVHQVEMIGIWLMGGQCLMKFYHVWMNCYDLG